MTQYPPHLSLLDAQYVAKSLYAGTSIADLAAEWKVPEALFLKSIAGALENIAGITVDPVTVDDNTVLIVTGEQMDQADTDTLAEQVDAAFEGIPAIVANFPIDVTKMTPDEIRALRDQCDTILSEK